jgi:hypothetical protein
MGKIDITKSSLANKNMTGTTRIDLGNYYKSPDDDIPSIDESLSIPNANRIIKSGRFKSGSINEAMSKANTAWVYDNGKMRPSTKPNRESLEPGLYMIDYDDFGIYLEKKVLNHDSLFEMPDDITQDMLTDMEKFWTRKDKYEEYGITYKRGLMMYGPPGTGKSSMVYILIDKLINLHGGIALFATENSLYLKAASIIRALEPDKPILTIIEELESYLARNSENEFLSILDGELQLDNVVYLATTNHIEKLPPRIVNRPSRFDTLFFVDMPSSSNRRFYLERILKPDDLSSIDLDRWVMDTEDMSLSHIKDLVVSVIVMDNSYEESITKLKRMNEMNFK